MEDEKKQTEYNEEVDYFSKFMFGDRFMRKKEEGQSSIEESFNETENTHIVEKTPSRYEADPFSWILKDGKEQSREQQGAQSILENIDYLELMENIDTLMDSAKKFKPLIKKVRPMLESFLKK